jgi:hypothetical protein
MTIGSTITLTYDAGPKILVRVDDSGAYTAKYFLAETLVDYELKITHTIPATRGAGQESHLVQLTVTTHDAQGVITRVEVAWTVLKTHSGYIQNTAELTFAHEALASFFSTGSQLASLLGRDS